MILFGIKDNFADSKATYKNLQYFATSTDIYKIPKTYIDAERPYYNTYYFSDRNKAELFMAGLEYKYMEARKWFWHYGLPKTKFHT